MLKKHEVVMLSTEKASKIYLNTIDKVLTHNHFYDVNSTTAQHLYILETKEDKIEEGNITFNDFSGSIVKILKEYPEYYDVEFITGKGNLSKTISKVGGMATLHKIIASTDESLGLAKVSEGFIKKFIEKYNAGTPITDVMVEYDLGEKWMDSINNELIKPKLDSHNTITIKPVKDSYTLEEVKRLCSKAYLITPNYDNLLEDFDKWFEQQNL